jgi:hypothetical protein
MLDISIMTLIVGATILFCALILYTLGYLI